MQGYSKVGTSSSSAGFEHVYHTSATRIDICAIRAFDASKRIPRLRILMEMETETDAGRKGRTSSFEDLRQEREDIFASSRRHYGWKELMSSSISI